MDSYPYSWAYCLDRKLFLESLDNLDDILTGDITLMPSGMFRCEKYQISFHASKEKDALFVDGKPNEEVVRLELASLKKKIKHLVEKFYSLFQSDKKSLFVIKVKHSESDENIKFVKDLFKKIDEYYKSKNFVLLVVFEEKYISNELLSLESDRLKIRGVKEFADDKHTDTTGDLEGWKKIFSEL